MIYFNLLALVTWAILNSATRHIMSWKLGGSWVTECLNLRVRSAYTALWEKPWSCSRPASEAVVAQGHMSMTANATVLLSIPTQWIIYYLHFLAMVYGKARRLVPPFNTHMFWDFGRKWGTEYINTTFPLPTSVKLFFRIVCLLRKKKNPYKITL